MTAPALHRFALPTLSSATVAMAVLAATSADPAGWRLGLTIAAGLAGGSIIAAACGRLLSRGWLSVVEDELLPAGATLLLVALLGGAWLIGGGDPGLFGADGAAVPTERRGWFSPVGAYVRFAFFAALGIAMVAALILAEGRRFRIAALALPVFSALFALTVIDWVTLRSPVWWTALQPIGFMVNQVTAALAIAFIYHLVQRETAKPRAFASLAAALLTLALLDLWIGFVQFLVAWYGNLPEAARWYLVREAWLPGGLLTATLLQSAGALILIVRRTHAAMLAAAILLLAAYLTNAAWLAGEALPDDPAGWVQLALLLTLWAGWVAHLARVHDRCFGGNEVPMD